MHKKSILHKVFVIDVDGVMTTGQLCYTENGKTMKIFGPDDHDALSLLRKFMEIRFVTGDRSGFKISQRRIVSDMKFKLDLVSTIKRVEWISEQYNLKEVIYMGDGIFDHYESFHWFTFNIADIFITIGIIGLIIIDLFKIKKKWEKLRKELI